MTSLHLHHLTGCAPEPLAYYLKALGALRLVAEQKDPTARGWWRDEHFCLLTVLAPPELERFFLEDYKPTPLLAPWNGGSGFFRTWDKKTKRLRKSKNGRSLDELVESKNPRLSLFKDAYRLAVAALRPSLNLVDVDALADEVRSRLLIVADGEGPSFPVATKDDEGKGAIQRAMLRGCRGNPFYGSSIVDGYRKDGSERILYPSLWGSGGNDGAIDYSGRFFENINQVIKSSDSSALLRSALSGVVANGVLTGAAGKVGQFLPCGAGGANVTTGVGTQNDTQLNPWDFVLALEGAVLFLASVTKRFGSDESASGAVPFAVRAQPAGHGTAGTEKNDDGEQWMPVWSRPVTILEFQALLIEGRAQVGRKSAQRPIDVARAVARLGIARGIQRFTRFGFLERNGQSNLAVPLGRIDVIARPLARLVDDVAAWLDRLQRLARDKNAPARLIHAERRFADAVFAVLTHDRSPERWQAVLVAAAAVEVIQVSGTAFEPGPIPPLSPEWLDATDDGNVEWRLARALGSAAAMYERDGRARDPIRNHWLPLEKGNRRFRVKDKRLFHDPRVVIGGRDAVADFAAVVERRLLEAAQVGRRNLPLVAARGCGAAPADLGAVIAGEVDLSRVSALARAFMAVRWERWRPAASSGPLTGTRPDEPWIALRLASLPWSLDESRTIPADEAIIRRLRSGDGSAAVEIALRRLRAAGLRPPIRGATADRVIARLWAAALVFPISNDVARELARSFEPTSRR